ncbi:MAG: ATPase, T2SS/T4P/T4SS family [Patescibacteria group bacterium]
MRPPSQTLKELLVKENYISAEDMKQAEESAKFSRADVIDYLLGEDLITGDLLGQAIAESLGMPYADLNSNQPLKDQVLKVPEEIAKKFRIVLFHDKGQEWILTTDSLEIKKLIVELKKLIPDKKVTLAYSLSEDIDESLMNYRKTLDTRFNRIIKEKGKVAPEILEEIFADAITYRASDIHFEPEETEVLIRFRVDGVLQEAGRLPKEYYENIVNRIKVKSHLRTDEHYAAQDGSLRYTNGDVWADMRISIAPTLDGEKIVIRLLSQYVRGFSLSDLGLSDNDQKIVEVAADKPFGMILVVGPTGSGKSTTLYALLKKLNTPDINITTIEDPVEYKIKGANQIQVNSQTGLTFSRGLRSIVRQDPDIILVGEIRDTETAEIAVNAALTGHLLLSTFHANDAATGIPRLLDMAVEPFLLASTLEIILAQRLVRKICDGCRVSRTYTQKEVAKSMPRYQKYFKGSSVTLYQGKGCPVCNGSGYHGRTAIFELISVTPELQDLILHRPSTKEIWDLAKKQGSHTLFEDGIDKVKTGLTTLEEVLRVASPPDDFRL